MSPRTRSRRARAAIVLSLVVVVALLASACSGAATADRAGGPGATAAEIGAGGAAVGPSNGGSVAPTTTEYRPTTTSPLPGARPVVNPTCPASVDAATFPGREVGRTPSTTAPKSSSTTASSTASAVPPTGAGPSTPPTTASDARGALDTFRRDPRMAGTTVAASVWLQGEGEIVAENPEGLLIPASNQKILTAIGAYNLLDPDEHLYTDVIATGPIDDGVLHGDLVLVGGGDPTVTRTGPNSIDGLAQVMADRGLRQVEGRILVDESRYDSLRTAPNWPNDWLYSVGPLSALGVDHNMITKDRVYVDDPAVGNGQVLRFALTARGVPVSGGVEHGKAEQGVRLARLESPTIEKLLTTMLLYSDNFIAELLVKEIAVRQTRQAGSTADGLAAINEVLTRLCVPLSGVSVDGSGLSRDDKRSAREFRRLLQVAELQPWGDAFVSGFSIAGEEDAIGGRLAGPITAGRIRAKGGFLFVTRSLSGYLTTAAGRHAVFSIVVNGPLSVANNKVEGAMDDFLTTLTALPPA